MLPKQAQPSSPLRAYNHTLFSMKYFITNQFNSLKAQIKIKVLKNFSKISNLYHF